MACFVIQRGRRAMGAALMIWMGRCSSFVVFAVGGSEVTPPLQPPPPPFQNVLGAIFLFVVAMIFGAMAEIVGTYLRSLDVLGRDSGSGRVDPRMIHRYSKYIFKTFGMGI